MSIDLTQSPTNSGTHGRLPALTGIRVGIPVLLTATIAGLFHVMLGSSPLVVAISVATLGLAVYPLTRNGVFDLAAILIAILGFRLVGFPLFAKLFLGQSLDSNLVQPLSSHFLALAGMSGYVLASLLVRSVKVRRPVLSPPRSAAQIRRISYMFAILGLGANLIVAAKLGAGTSDITIAPFFITLLHLGLIAGIASRLILSGGKHTWDPWILFLVVLEVSFAFLRNSRMGILEVPLIFVVTNFAFGGRLKWRHLITVGIAIAIVVLLTPLFLNVRRFRAELPWIDRAKLYLRLVAERPDVVQEYEAANEQQGQTENYLLTYYGRPQNILERMSYINHVDAVKSAIDRVGMVKWEDLSFGIKRAMPSLIMPDKPRGYGHGDWIYCEAELGCRLGNYLTISLIPNGYAAFGWLGGVLYPLILGFLVFLITRITSGWDLRGNIWSVYFLLRLHNHFVEGSSATYVSLVLRDLPQDLIVILLVYSLSRYSIRLRRSRKISKLA